jgi:hypothetical protein
MSLRHGAHTLKCPHRRLTGTSAPGPRGDRFSGGEC